MKGYQQLRFGVNDRDLSGNYIPKIQISLVKEVYISIQFYTCSEDILKSELVEKELRNSDREKFVCPNLNIRNQIISYEFVSICSLHPSIAHRREVYKAAILANVASVLFIHNHPSGSTEPSINDIEITKRLA